MSTDKITQRDIDLAVEYFNNESEYRGSPVRVRVQGRYNYHAVELYTGTIANMTSNYGVRNVSTKKQAYNMVQAMADVLSYMRGKDV